MFFSQKYASHAFNVKYKGIKTDSKPSVLKKIVKKNFFLDIFFENPTCHATEVYTTAYMTAKL